MTTRPPLTPPDCDLTDFPRMMIDIPRLHQSEFDATIDDSAWRAGINLWFSAWHSVPAGSLAADDASLAKAAGLGRDVRSWRKVRSAALRGFIECSDGRLYHETVSEFALEAWLEKLVQRISSGAGNAKRWGGEFDPAPVEAEIDAASDMLAALNPQSKAIAKAKRRHSRRHPDGNAGGKENRSHRDSENIPSGSLEKGTGTGNIVPLPSGNGVDSPIDYQKRAFDLGVEVLGAKGTTAAQARSLVGKWRKVAGDQRVGDLLEQARGKADPVEWVAAAVNNRAGEQDALFRAIDLKYATVGGPPQ